MTDKAGYPQAAFGGEPRFHSVTVTGGEIWAADPPESGNWVHVNQHMALLAKLDAALFMPAPAQVLNMEVCGKCMGTGTAGHPDSGYTCDCDGGMVATPAQAWREISTAPYGTEVIVRAGRMTFAAVLCRDASMDSDGNDCDQWQAFEEGQHPPCWSGGACWESNEDEMPSLQPEAWMPVSAALIPDTEGGA